MEVHLHDNAPARRPIDNVEIVYLSIIVFIAILLNLVVFIQLLRQSRTPTARTSFLAGPYHLSSFTLFKLNLGVTDFIILLIHAFGKIVWLITYDWRFGSYGCKIYQFMSAMGFYANSNIIVMIGLDRLKVVYTSHVQGATSVRRVRFMITVAWLLSVLCSLPQLFVWKTYQVSGTFMQCVSVFQIVEHEEQKTERWQMLEMIYEIGHQAAVFWIPFSIIFVSYFLIVLRLLHHTLSPVKIVRPSRSSASQSHHSAHSPVRIPYACEQQIQKEAISMDRLDQPTRPVLSSWISKSFKQCIESHPRRNAQQILCCPKRNGFSFHERTPSLPVWRRQVRSRIFLTALAVVAAHVTMWLPYNLISTLRLIDYNKYTSVISQGATFLEDLIVVNSLLNPLLYAYRCR